MTEIPKKRFFRAYELAREMGVKPETVRRWIRHDQVNHVHFPDGARIPRDEFLFIVEHGPRPRPL